MRGARSVRRAPRPALIFVGFAVLAVTALGLRTVAAPARSDAAPGITTPGVAASGIAAPGAAGAVTSLAGATPRPLVCVDPGHSLSNPSIVVTVPVAGRDGIMRDVELREVDINLDIARELARRLRAHFGAGAVAMTWGEVDNLPRGWNVLRGPAGDDKADVMARGAFCADQGARAIVSIHTNSYEDEPNGALTGYRDANDRALALAVHGSMYHALSFDPLGVPVPDFTDYGLDHGEWFIALGVDDRDVPVVILEPVMMSDTDEARRLVPTIAEAPAGRRAQIARVEADALGAWIQSTLLTER
jgi:N-acetylmuramoyl-L-alanine amidase